MNIYKFSSIRLRYIAVLLITAAFLILTGEQRITAAEEKKLPYLIKVNRYHNVITIYETDETGAYTIPIKAITCSVGSGSRTITGTFPLKEKHRWKALMGDVWGQYATRIVGGILFHSVYYYENGNPASLATTEYNKLGKAASHGCIRLTVLDAKWIYDNCPSGTPVEIYDDKSSPGPLGKPKTIKIDKTIRWDPTDPDVRNPYLTRLPKLIGIENRRLEWAESIDLMEGVTAFSSYGQDITKNIQVEGEVDPYIAGVYKVYYYIEDEFDRIGMKVAKITVEDCKDTPIIMGVKDKVVANQSQLTEEYVKENIKIYCSGRKLDSRLLQVNIERKSDLEYDIIYKVDLGNKNIQEEQASVFVDDIAPSLSGVVDKAITRDRILTQEDVLTDITVTDNYSKLTVKDVLVAMEQTEDGNYVITYTVADAAGNVCNVQAKYYYQ